MPSGGLADGSWRAHRQGAVAVVTPICAVVVVHLASRTTAAGRDFWLVICWMLFTLAVLAAAVWAFGVREVAHRPHPANAGLPAVIADHGHGRTLTAIRPPFMVALKRRGRLATARSRGWPITSLKGRPKPNITSLASISSHCSSMSDLTGAVLMQSRLKSTTETDTRQHALQIVVGMIGGLALARAVADEQLAQEILTACQQGCLQLVER